MKNLRNLLNADSDSFNEKLKIAVCSVLGLKIIVGFALAAMLFGCERKPEFTINGIGYYTKERCVTDSTWTAYEYHYGYSYRGKWEYHFGHVYHHKCLKSKIDTLQIK